MASFYGVDPDQWLAQVCAEIAMHTDRPIVVKPKGQGHIAESLEDCWCVVTHSSNCAVDALLMGVPVITLGESAAETMSWCFEDIEKPHWPDRTWFFEALANHQWNLDEMRSGECWEMIKNGVV